jgi:hypothetical protein
VSEVRAIGVRRNNAELMADCAALGYLPDQVLDLTYGLGRFWTVHRPSSLVTNDLDPTKGAYHEDWTTRTTWPDRSFGAVVLDPPYKLNGTSTGKGPAASDSSYGVAGPYVTVAARHKMICDGIAEGARLARRYLLVKCQDQVVSGRVHWQTRIFADHAESIGLRLVDQLHVQGYRAQPAGRRQVHARRDYSTLLVLEAYRGGVMIADAEQVGAGVNQWVGAGGARASVIRSAPTLGWSECQCADYRPGVVLDPFAGAGTTVACADLAGRDAVGIELNPNLTELYPIRRAECARKLYGAPTVDPAQADLFSTLEAS